MRPQDTAYIIERLAVRFMAMVADHERQLAEHRASFGARTEADAKIIAGLRAERDRLQTQVQDMRAEMERLQMEVAALKSQTPKHPVKAGEWVTITIPTIWSQAGDVAKVLSSKHVGGLVEYKVQKVDGDVSCWRSDYCDPCDPPNHDTEAGKAVAEAAVKTEPVADDIKVGDLVEVVSNRGRNTWRADVGSLGTVTSVEEINESISVCLDDVPGKQNALAGYVSLCDVRKVTT